MQTASLGTNSYADYYEMRVARQPEMGAWLPKATILVVAPPGELEVDEDYLFKFKNERLIVRTLVAIDAETLTLETCSPATREVVQKSDLKEIHVVMAWEN